MESLINEDFLLGNGYARELYHESAEKQPIIDYHCHLVPQQVAENHRFADITEVWLGGDHYKWRALRGNGVGEDFITGNRSSCNLRYCNCPTKSSSRTAVLHRPCDGNNH